MKAHNLFLAISLSAFLAACGGSDGGSIASAPPPPPLATFVREEVQSSVPLPTTPGNITGTYAAVGGFSGNVSLAVDVASKTYTLTIPANGLPASSVVFAASANLGQRNTWVGVYSDGSTRPLYTTEETYGFFHKEIDVNDQTRVHAQMGLTGVGQGTGTPNRHVALGSWYFEELKPNGTGAWDSTGVSSQGYFAFGDRTASTDLPLTGTAHYAVTLDSGNFENCGDYGCYGANAAGFLGMDVDFAARTLSAEANTQFSNDSINLTTNLSGTAPITSSGDFSLALSGTGTLVFTATSTPPMSDIVRSLSGSIDGAFFGPQAAEIGGTYQLPVMGGDGSVGQISGAFGAVRD
jgi:hypothetical protein